MKKHLNENHLWIVFGGDNNLEQAQVIIDLEKRDIRIVSAPQKTGPNVYDTHVVKIELSPDWQVKAILRDDIYLAAAAAAKNLTNKELAEEIAEILNEIIIAPKPKKEFGKCSSCGKKNAVLMTEAKEVCGECYVKAKAKTKTNQPITEQLYDADAILKYADPMELFCMFHKFKEYFNHKYDPDGFYPTDAQIGEIIEEIKENYK